MDKVEARQTLSERRAQWRAFVDQAKDSGQPPRQFCIEKGLNLGRFYYWRRVFAMEAEAGQPEARFALVRGGAERDERQSSAVLELELGRGWRLRIPRGVEESTLRVVLGALSQSA